MTAADDPDLERERKRNAANSRRCRKRANRGQRVFRVTAHTERTRDLMIRKGLIIEDRATGKLYPRDWDGKTVVPPFFVLIEEALTKHIDDEGRK